jgi:phosphoribosylformylglycinamidine cyclo-ligase
VFEFVQTEGSVTDEEMHRTFNMGTGFVCALSPEDAADLVAETEGRIIGHVEQAETEDASVSIRGLTL